MFQILFLKVCNVSCNFPIVETLYRYFESHFKQRWCAKNLKLVSAIFLKFIIHLRWKCNNKQCLPVFALPENQNVMSPWLTLPYIYCFRLSEACSVRRKTFSLHNKLNDVYTFPDRIKSVLCAWSGGKLLWIHFHFASNKVHLYKYSRAFWTSICLR